MNNAYNYVSGRTEESVEERMLTKWRNRANKLEAEKADLLRRNAELTEKLNKLSVRANFTDMAMGL